MVEREDQSMRNNFVTLSYCTLTLDYIAVSNSGHYTQIKSLITHV
uniref:Uncharacterized protein n=1 Tax=Anguilla anguilla TaxID=7936 RepID=A0A0E9U3W4_ANGAN